MIRTCDLGINSANKIAVEANTMPHKRALSTELPSSWWRWRVLPPRLQAGTSAFT